MLLDLIACCQNRVVRFNFKTTVVFWLQLELTCILEVTFSLTMAKRGPYKSLTLDEKVKVIQDVERGAKRKCDIAKEYGILPNTLSSFLKNKNTLMENWNKKNGKSRKRVRTADYPAVDDCVLKWFKQTRDQNIPLSGPIIHAKAEEFAEGLGIRDFKASTGWFAGFNDRNAISFRNVCGESGSVSGHLVDEWHAELAKTIENYQPKNIFNVDETGLFFKCLPNKTFSFKNEKCSGGKNSKERLTILIGSNMDGSEKLPLLMIGKAAKPRCFKSARSLPVTYEANKKAWMTAALFEKWLLNLDKELGRKKRKILLFIDNCTAHNNLPSLTWIKIEYFPANMTSVVQPMDQGVIKNLKHFYRRQVVMKILGVPNKKSINVLDAAHMIHNAWNKVKPSTIAHCFRVAGFKIRNDEANEVANSTNTDWNHPEENTPDGWEDLNVDVSYEAYLNVDADVAICGTLTDGEILEEVMKNTQGSSEAEEEDEEDLQPEKPIPSTSEAVSMIADLKRFVEAQSNVNNEIFCAVSELEDFIQCLQLKKQKQTKITHFWGTGNSLL